MAFARFMSEPAGRVLRIALGIVMIAVCTGPIGSVTGVVIGVVGVVPILAGAFNFCLVGPLLGTTSPGNATDKPHPHAVTGALAGSGGLSISPCGGAVVHEHLEAPG